MPNYPSSQIQGAAPGVRAVSNVTNRRELRDTTNNTPGFLSHTYPTDQQEGTTQLSGQTDTLGDLQLIFNQLLVEIKAFEAIVGSGAGNTNPYTSSTIAANGSFTLAEQKYVVNLLALKMYHLQASIQDLVYVFKNLSANVTQEDTSGTLGTSRYPSGWNRGY